MAETWNHVMSNAFTLKPIRMLKRINVTVSKTHADLQLHHPLSIFCFRHIIVIGWWWHSLALWLLYTVLVLTYLHYRVSKQQATSASGICGCAVGSRVPCGLGFLQTKSPKGRVSWRLRLLQTKSLANWILCITCRPDHFPDWVSCGPSLLQTRPPAEWTSCRPDLMQIGLLVDRTSCGPSLLQTGPLANLTLADQTSCRPNPLLT